MATHLVQITDGSRVKVAVAGEPHLSVLTEFTSIYELAQQCVDAERSLEDCLQTSAISERIRYDEVYSGRSPWRLMAPIHVPGAPSRMLISGTGLTHLGSARQRQAMHLADQ